MLTIVNSLKYSRNDIRHIALYA